MILEMLAVFMLGQSTGTAVSQGRGDTGYSPWRVTEQACGTPTESVVAALGTAAANVPASQLARRRFLILQNKHATAYVTCRIDGSDPTNLSTSVGLRIGPGESLTYFIAASVVPRCISDTASTPVSVVQCL